MMSHFVGLPSIFRNKIFVLIIALGLALITAYEYTNVATLVIQINECYTTIFVLYNFMLILS